MKSTFTKINLRVITLALIWVFQLGQSHLFASKTSGETVLISEDFEDDSYEQNWGVKTLQGSTSWWRANYNNNYYMQMSGYNASGNELETYLITPPIDFDSYDSEVLTFKTKNGYYRGTTLTVWVSTNFDGNDVEAATWTQLQAVVDETDNANGYGSVFVESGNVDLSSYDGQGYVAFRYLGNSSVLTTTYQVDDVVVTGVEKSFDGTLVSDQAGDRLDFEYVELGQESAVQTYTLSYQNVSGDISITCPDGYFVSLDGSDWKSELDLPSGNGTGSADVKVKFVPGREYYYGTEVEIEHKVNDAMPYLLKVKPADAGVPTDATSLTKDQTLDVVTWNLQFFGISTKGTGSQSSFESKLNYVADKMVELDADIYALQEIIADSYHGDFLPPLVDKLNELAGETRYAGVLSDTYSFYFNEPSKEYPAQRVAFVYDLSTVSNLEDFSMFSDFYDGYATPDIPGYPTSDYLFWAGGRLPQIMKTIVKVNGKSQLINLVNIHAKCCDDAERRLADATYLYDELMANYNNDNLVILGDYNESYSAFGGAYAQWYTNDNKDFMHAAGSTLDHLAVSNELYYEYQALSNNTQIEEVSYSDHDPILLRMLIDSEKEKQTVSLGAIADQEAGTKVTLNATATSGLPVQYMVVNGKASVTGSQLMVEGVGEIVVQAAQVGDAQFAPAFSQLVTFNGTKGSQTIDFAQIEDVAMDVGSFTLNATASSGLPVSYEVVSGNVTVEGDVVTLNGVGDVTIKAMQEGNEDFEAAPEVSVSFKVLKGQQQIDFTAPENKKVSDGTFELSATASSGLTVTYEVVSGDIQIQGNTVTINGAGDVSVKASQEGDDNYYAADDVTVSFNIAKGDQTITFETIATKNMADETFELEATASSGLAVSYAVVSGNITIEGTTVTLVEAGEATIKAMQGGNEDYNAAPEVTQTFIIEEKSGIEDEYARQVNVYPNPTPGMVVVTTPDVEEKTIKVIGLSGKTLKEVKVFGTENILDLDELNNGLYFVQITSGNITIAKKLQVRR